MIFIVFEVRLSFHQYQPIILFPLCGDNSNDSLSHLPNFSLSYADTIPYAIAFNDRKNPLYTGSFANPITWSMKSVKFS